MTIFFQKMRRKIWGKYANYVNNKFMPRAIPTQLGLALTSACNIRCPYCMRESFKPPAGNLTLEQVKGILSKMPYVSGVCIMGLCEPLLNPQATDIIRWLKDEKAYSISFTTNGTIPFDDDKLDALLRVDDMAYSVDTNDHETFKVLRGGANLTKVMDNLNKLIEFKRIRGLSSSDNPPIHINAVITSLNFHQIPGLIKMFEPYSEDITYLMIDPVTRPDYSEFEDPFILKREEFEKFVPEYSKIARESSVQVIGFDWMFKQSTEWDHCKLSWNGMFVEPNGDAYFCYHYDYIIGNVFEQDPLEVWNSPRAKEFRNKLSSSDPPLMQCRFCNFARSKWQPGGEYYTKMEDVEILEIR